MIICHWRARSSPFAISLIVIRLLAAVVMKFGQISMAERIISGGYISNSSLQLTLRFSLRQDEFVKATVSAIASKLKSPAL